MRAHTTNLRGQPAFLPAHSRPTKGRNTRVMGLMATERVTRVVPISPPFQLRCTAAAYVPSRASASMMASLCAAITKLVRNSGLATESHSARRGLTPCSRARRGITHMHAITETTHRARNSSTATSGLPPDSVTTSCSIHRKTGP